MSHRTCTTCQYNVVGTPIAQLPTGHPCRHCLTYSNWSPAPTALPETELTLSDHIDAALDQIAVSFSEEASRLANMSRSALRQVGGDHYKEMGVEPWDVVDTWPDDQRIGAYRAGALKYLMRMGAKGPAEQDAAKAHHYLEKLLEVLRANR